MIFVNHCSDGFGISKSLFRWFWDYHTRPDSVWWGLNQIRPEQIRFQEWFIEADQTGPDQIPTEMRKGNFWWFICLIITKRCNLFRMVNIVHKKQISLMGRHKKFPHHSAIAMNAMTTNSTRGDFKERTKWYKYWIACDTTDPNKNEKRQPLTPAPIKSAKQNKNNNRQSAITVITI